MGARIAPESFGRSVERFVFSFELIDSPEGRRGTKRYISFTSTDEPSLPSLSSIGQVIRS